MSAQKKLRPRMELSVGRHGRPPLDLYQAIDRLPAGWQHQALELFADGASKEEVKRELGLYNKLWDRLISLDEEFRETIEKGEELSYSWWMREGRVNLRNPRFNYVGWIMNMKNRFRKFGWVDKPEAAPSQVTFVQNQAVVLNSPELNQLFDALGMGSNVLPLPARRG